MSGWTVDTLKEHFDSRIQSVEDSAKLALAAAERAAEKADEVFEKRMDNTNEWRNTLESLMANFVSKESVRWAVSTLIVIGGLVISAYAVFT